MRLKVFIPSAAIAAAIAIAALLFLDFVRDTRGFRPIANGADAIVVLTGGKGRTTEGLALLRKGKAKVLILSGVHEDADLDAIFLRRVSTIERPSIILEKNSTSTFENALEVRKIMEERGLDSMVLITSAYHLKRALYTFSRVMPDGMRIDGYGVATSNFDEQRWWSGRGLALMGAEFVKYYWYVARFAVSAPPAR